ncbi:ras-related protein Rab-34 isoform X6 [Gorilla gorilla gorilla]|uniref:ras-related protein Rab-34 isoform X4 n=1 Tax=Homo sapiens TaxID=9606 RepID=UPI001FB050DA|nr:ras-related protein Rab-34 isoform X4 [Homo sapiens]XP_054173451.1 ras-related protein Rab-34 isoform X4 [Homo sapiens]
MSHLPGLELRREAPPLLGPLLSPFPLPAGSWHRQMLRSSLRFPITNSAGAPCKAAGRMNILAPVRRDRVLAELPQCLRKEAALHGHKDFHPRVTCACQEHRTGTVGFCKDTFDKNYKATIGVDFEMERFEVLGIPFSLQLWDTAGQERFKCIASTYYRGAQAIIIVFNLNDVASLEHTKQWLADALKENDPSSVLLFLTPAQYALMEKDALQVAQEMKAEYWAVSSLTGENVREFFFRVAALTFEANVLAELEKSGARRIGDVVRINSDDSNLYLTASKKKPTCCP